MAVNWKNVVLNSFPSARCLHRTPSAFQYSQYWTIVDSSDRPMGPTALYSEEDAWRFAAEKLKLGVAEGNGG